MLWLKGQLGKELEGGPELESTSGHQGAPAVVLIRVLDSVRATKAG